MSQSEIHVRLAATRDRRAIAGCDARVAADLHRRELVDAAIAARQCWVGELDGALAGYGVLTGNFFGRDFIDLLFVAERARRKGVGEAILQTIERTRRAGRIFTSTTESNAAMRGLLAKRGYRPSGRIENLDPGDPELIFVKFPDGENTK
ncbi:MAG TPA: GNAT family N-acetyltransferase [Rhizomicrobium sp.]|nr:GNAT family N-acetyltransferase [Rhizomicrobium sp.]